MGSYGNPTFGYKVLIFILFVFLLVFGYIAISLYLQPKPEEVTVTLVITATPVTPTEIPDEAVIGELQRFPDDLKILKAIFGETATYQFSDVDGKAEAKWVPEADGLGPFPANGVRPYLTRVLQIGLGEEANSPDELIVFLQSAPSPALSVECKAVMGVAELSYQAEKLQLVSFQAAMQPEDGLCLVPQIETISLGEGFPGFLFHHTYTEKGETISKDEYYLSEGEGYSLVFALETAHENAAACPPGCFSVFSEVEFVPNEAGGLDDLRVATRGTQVVDGVVLVVNESSLYRFTDGVYTLVPDVEE